MKKEPNCFIDRELSWLQFNYRVLMEADDNSVPPLERLNFLKIYYSNLEEFFAVRVGSLVHRKLLDPEYLDPSTKSDAATQLKYIWKEVFAQQKLAANVCTHLLYDLKADGIEIVDMDHISKLDESIAKKLFAEIKDYISPRIVDAKRPVPFIGSGEVFVADLVQKGEKKHIAITALYRVPPFRVYDNNGVTKVFLMSDVVRHFSKNHFKKYTVLESVCCRVTRNADVYVSETGSYGKSSKTEMEKLLKKRKRQQPVRLELSDKITKAFREQLCFCIGLNEKNCYINTVPFELGFRSSLGDRPTLKYRPQKGIKALDLKRGEYFDYIDKQDIMLAHPYQSMNSFIDVLYEAAADPEVSSIKITLYRMAESSKVAMAAAYAADMGKDVLTVLELRARFDEKNNIDYSEMLKASGCRVVYGLTDYKVHSKLCLITRNTESGVRYITQVGSGNYNETTSELYSDLSLITADQEIGEDAEAAFAALETGNLPPDTKKLMIAPNGFLPRILSLLDEEKQKGPGGFVAIKVNSLNDPDVMKKLIECSQAGCRVELYIRGICCLRPGIKGYTDNIIVKSAIGRYLEHSRIYLFGKGSEQKIYMGSGDLLTRNTRRRVECMIPITSPELMKDISEILASFREDTDRAWLMQSDGSFRRLGSGNGSAAQDRQYRYFTAKPQEQNHEQNL